MALTELNWISIIVCDIISFGIKQEVLHIDHVEYLFLFLVFILFYLFNFLFCDWFWFFFSIFDDLVACL